MAMTSRERVLAALRHEEPDRLPIDFGARHSVHLFAHRELKQHLGFSGGDEAMRSYLTYTAEPDPRLVEYLGSDVVGFNVRAGKDFVFKIDPATNSWVDEWGIEYHMPPDGLYYDPSGFPLATAETVAEVERYPFPDPSDPSRVAAIAGPLKAAYDAGDKAIMLNAPTNGIWMTAIYLRGLEQGLMDLVLQPKIIAALAERIGDWYVALWDNVLPQIGDYVDVIQMEGDLGQQNGPMFSPKLFKEVFKPQLAKVNAAIKRKSKAKVLLHACGSVRWAIPDLIDAGVDVLNPVQVNAADMDTALLKRDFGRDLTFWGGGCDTIVLQHGSVADVEAEVKRRVADLGPGGGYVFGSIHNIQAHVPPENIVAMFKTARAAGQYPLDR